MIRFTDSNGNQLPANVSVDPTSQGFEIFAQDSHGNPLLCLWQLANRGGTMSVGLGASATTISRRGQSYFGVLENYQGTAYAPIITVSTPSTSTIYYPAPPDFYDGTLLVTVTAVPTNGEKARSIYLEVQNTIAKI